MSGFKNCRLQKLCAWYQTWNSSESVSISTPAIVWGIRNSGTRYQAASNNSQGFPSKLVVYQFLVCPVSYVRMTILRHKDFIGKLIGHVKLQVRNLCNWPYLQSTLRWSMKEQCLIDLISSADNSFISLLHCCAINVDSNRRCHNSHINIYIPWFQLE